MNTSVVNSERTDPGVERTPHLSLFELSMGGTLTQAMAVSCQLRLPDLLATRPRTSGELASAAGVDPDVVARLTRVLTSVGITQADVDGVMSLTPFGEPLRSDAVPSLRAWTLMAGSNWFWGPLGQLGTALADRRSGFDIEYGTDVFDLIDHVPEARAEYDAAMGGVMALEAIEISAVYDFAAHRRVLDVGGGDGSLCLQLLESNPHLTGAVLDRSVVVAEATPVVDRPGAERCDWHAGDFLEHVPSGADVYVLSRILHDWDDSRAGLILRRIRQAMIDDARLLVVEQLLDEDDRPFTPLCDLNMAALYGTGERSRCEIEALFEGAGLQHVETTQLRSGRFLIEGRVK